MKKPKVRDARFNRGAEPPAPAALGFRVRRINGEISLLAEMVTEWPVRPTAEEIDNLTGEAMFSKVKTSCSLDKASWEGLGYVAFPPGVMDQRTANYCLSLLQDGLVAEIGDLDGWWFGAIERPLMLATIAPAGNEELRDAIVKVPPDCQPLVFLFGKSRFAVAEIPYQIVAVQTLPTAGEA